MALPIPQTSLKRTRIVWPSPRCLEISLPAGYLSSGVAVPAGEGVHFCIFRRLMTSA